MHFRILKMIATSGFLTALECIKHVFGRGSAPDPAGGLQRSPDLSAGLRGSTSKERGGKGKERVRGEEGEGRGAEGGKKSTNTRSVNSCLRS